MAGRVNAPVNISASGDNVVLAAVPGKILRVLNVVLIPAAAVVIKFTDGLAGAVLAGPMTVQPQGIWPGYLQPWAAGGTLSNFDTSPGNALVINLGAAIQVGGFIGYTIISP
jgi:hypothetical protein